MALKKDDFVELEYTGNISDTGEVFDTTDVEVAKVSGIYQKDAVFGAVTICLGQGFILQGLEQRLVGKDIGEHSIELPPEEGFGKKSTKLIQLVPTSKFTKQKIAPIPGLQINVDGLIGTIKHVTGGRTIVDFNHPLSGKSLHYVVKVKRIVTDDKEKVEAILKWQFRIDVPEIEIKDGALSLNLPGLPGEMQEEISSKVKSLTGVKNLMFEDKEKAQKLLQEEHKLSK
jgi:FKBP-type peptidyl-prolyl cis-trans isomerase 2